MGLHRILSLVDLGLGLVVGTSHFGYEAVQTILKNEPNAEIHLYERGAGASFMG